MLVDGFGIGVSGMNVKRKRIRLSVYPHTSPEIGGRETMNSDRKAADQTILRLARLLGRQIAREQFHATGNAEQATKPHKS